MSLLLVVAVWGCRETLPKMGRGYLSHTIPSPSQSQSRADGTVAFGNPRPLPWLPCTLCSPADSASSHDWYTAIAKDPLPPGVDDEVPGACHSSVNFSVKLSIIWLLISPHFCRSSWHSVTVTEYPMLLLGKNLDRRRWAGFSAPGATALRASGSAIRCIALGDAGLLYIHVGVAAPPASRPAGLWAPGLPVGPQGGRPVGLGNLLPSGSQPGPGGPWSGVGPDCSGKPPYIRESE